MNHEDVEFTETRLAEVVSNCGGETAETIVTKVFAEIDRHAGAAPQHDDITLMVVKRLAE